MKFSDGMHFDSSGDYRLIQRGDGWYVIGRNMILPVRTATEGTKVIAEMKELRKLRQKRAEVRSTKGPSSQKFPENF